MTIQELQDIVLRNSADISALHRDMSELMAKEGRAGSTLTSLRSRLQDSLLGFDRDRYKATDERLRIEALATEILIFERLGYTIGVPGSQFILGVAALLQGRNQAALDLFKSYLNTTDAGDSNRRHASYLAGMICYNRRDFTQALHFFESAFRYSLPNDPDWQSKIYIAELLSFLRRPQPEVERAFAEVREELSRRDETTQTRFLLATLELKLGNCFVETFLEPKERNPAVNTTKAISYYKEARKACPLLGPESLLPITIDYSLAQALISANAIDMDLQETPFQMLAGVVRQLRKIVLTKREEIILAQTYFMLGTCAVYSPAVSRDAGEIYLEYARHQTLTVPSDMCFFSCITKELLSRSEFVWQIDYFAGELERRNGKR